MLGLVLLPLFINATVAASFDTVYLWPKVWWIYGVILPTALLVVVQGRRHLSLVGSSRLLSLLGALMAWLLLGALIRGDRAEWWGMPDRADGVVMHGVYALVLLAGWTQGRERDGTRRILQGLTVCGTLLALTSLSQQLRLMGVPGDGAFQGIIATLAGGTLGQRGYMGGALALLLPVAMAFAATAEGRARWWALTAVALMGWAFIGTYTRGAWLAGALGLGWLVVWQGQQIPRPVWLSLLAGGTLFGVMSLTLPPIREFKQGLLDGSQRAVLWNSATFGIPKKPLLGWGVPAVWRAMAERPEGDLLREWGITDAKSIQVIANSGERPPSFVVTQADNRRAGLVMPVDKVHNEYLEYALTYGAPAALLFIALLFGAVWRGRAPGAVPGVSAALVAYAAYLMTWPEVIRFAPLAWFLMGVAWAQRPITATRTSER